VIAGLVPIDLVAIERKALYDQRGTTGDTEIPEREKTLTKWQELWEVSEKGRWTYRLIPQIKPWFERKHGLTTFRITQCLSGHGVFYNFLNGINRSESACCIYCSDPSDTAEHTVFSCPRWEQDRRGVERGLDILRLTPENMVPQMLQGQRQWTIIGEYLERIISTKETDERNMKG
jgi:hypothetical protein